MKITCDSCQSKYNVSDDKVQGKTVKIRCKKCGATLIVNGAGAQASAPASNGANGSNGAGDASFTVNVAEGDQRTMTMGEVVAAYNERVIDQETYVWADGMGDWMPLGQVESIVAALNAPSAHEAVAPAYEPPASQHGYDAPPQQQAYEPPPQAYAAPAAEQRRAAVVKREGSRGTRDLFAGGAGMEEVASSAPAFDGSGGMPPPAVGATGQRNENSVLFSLSALTRTETPAPAAVSGMSGSSGRTEDSGLIDLKALTESAAAVAPRHDDMPAPLFPSAVASPFGSPLGGYDAGVPLGSVAPPAQKKNMAVILVIAGTIVALAGIIAVAIVVKSGRDRDAAAAAAAASAAAAPTTPATTSEPVASTAPSFDPTPAATTSTSATVAAAKKPPVAGVKPPPGGVVAPPPKPPPGGGDVPAPPKPPPKPAGGDCGCNGDLMCLMGCRAKK